MNSTSRKAARLDQVRALTIERLNQLEATDLKKLSDFAERRLGRCSLNWFASEDAVQKALLSIVRGTGKGGTGRRPNMEQLRTKDTFLHYIRSAINSVIEATKRNHELSYFHESIYRTEGGEEKSPIDFLAAIAEPDGDASLVDLKRELFARLRARASSRLAPTIDEWEKTFFWASYVPRYQKADHRSQIRLLAMRVLREITNDLSR